MTLNEDLGLYICSICEIEDGRPTLRWEKQDFDMCLVCLKVLFFKYVSDDIKVDEKVVVRRKNVNENLRNLVLQKCNNKCISCKSIKDLQVDHITPFSLGGETSLDNLQILCRSCNRIKSNNPVWKTKNCS